MLPILITIENSQYYIIIEVHCDNDVYHCDVHAYILPSSSPRGIKYSLSLSLSTSVDTLRQLVRQ